MVRTLAFIWLWIQIIEALTEMNLTLFTMWWRPRTLSICSFLPPSSPLWTCNLVMILLLWLSFGAEKLRSGNNLFLSPGLQPDSSLLSIPECQTGFSHLSRSSSLVQSQIPLYSFSNPPRVPLAISQSLFSPQGLYTYCSPHLGPSSLMSIFTEVLLSLQASAQTSLLRQTLPYSL